VKRVAVGVVGLAALAYVCGTLLRLGALPGRWGYALAGYVGLLGSLWIISRLLREVALIQGRQMVETALGGLGPEWRIYSAVRLVGVPTGPAVADYLAVGPGGRPWPLIVDTTSPRAGRRIEEVLARGARTAAALRAAQAADALPSEIGVDPGAAVTAVVVAVRRRVDAATGADVAVVNPRALRDLLTGGPAEAPASAGSMPGHADPEAVAAGETGPEPAPACDAGPQAVPGSDVAERSP
jgi:hypothetical protein